MMRKTMFVALMLGFLMTPVDLFAKVLFDCCYLGCSETKIKIMGCFVVGHTEKNNFANTCLEITRNLFQ